MRSSASAQRLSDAISEQLGIDIVRGVYAVGQALPPETTLAKTWNVSRTAVREGIRVLASRGMVETRTKAGTTVRRRSQWHLLDPGVLDWMRQAGPDTIFMRSLIELRLIVGPQAAALAAKRRTDDDLARLQDSLDIMAGAERAEETARRASIRFHRTVLEAARNPALLPLAASIEAAVAWSNSWNSGRGIRVRDSVVEHQRILDAVRAGNDIDARWWMEAVIRTTADALIARPGEA